MAQHLTGASPQFRSLYNQVHGLMLSRRGPALAKLQAYDRIQQLLARQSAALSYVDVFRYLALARFVCIPLVFLLKKVKAKHGAVAAH